MIIWTGFSRQPTAILTPRQEEYDLVSLIPQKRRYMICGYTRILIFLNQIVWSSRKFQWMLYLNL